MADVGLGEASPAFPSRVGHSGQLGLTQLTGSPISAISLPIGDLRGGLAAAARRLLERFSGNLAFLIQSRCDGAVPAIDE